MSTKATAATASAESDVFMLPTVGPADLAVHPFPRPAALLRDVATALGVTEAVAEKELYGARAANVRAAKILAVFRRRGDEDRAILWLAPLDAAGSNTARKVDALLASAEADCAEDCAEARYHANPCEQTARAWIQASAIERTRAEQKEAELRAKWGIEA